MARPRFTRLTEPQVAPALRYVERLLDGTRGDAALAEPKKARAKWVAGKAETAALEPLAQGLWIAEWVDTFMRPEARVRFQTAMRQHAARQRSKRVRVVLELDPAEAARLKAVAKRAGASVSRTVAALVRYALGTSGWKSMLGKPSAAKQ